MAKELTKSEILAAASMAADMCTWIIYDPQDPDQPPVEEWIERYRPSQLYSDDGIGWICARSPGFSSAESQEKRDPRGLQEAFELLQKSGAEICFKSICDLAQRYRVLSGKWMFWASTGLKVDHLWSIVAKETATGRLGCTAKVSAVKTKCDPFTDSSHVVCIYVEDFTNTEEVMDLEAAIRRTGIRTQLSFKPDVYTNLGVYSGNKWGLRPIIYESIYHIIERKSHISRLTERYV